MSSLDVDPSVEMIVEEIRDVSAIQTVNAIFQYCPQFLFQSFLIIYLKYKCLLTGVSVGLACFSFLWHISIHFFYLIKHIKEDYRLNDSIGGRVASMSQQTQMIDNLSTSLNSNTRSVSSAMAVNEDGILSGPLQLRDVGVTNISDNFKNFEKPSYKTDVKNFVATAKKHDTKNVEKAKIFGFNKRRPIYEKDDFDVTADSQLSTVFFEINDSCMTSSKLGNISMDSNGSTSMSKETNVLSHSMESLNDRSQRMAKARKMCASADDLKASNDNDQFGCSDSMLSISGSRNSLLKRKGICSSQEMLHLVDVMSSNILPEQVDMLAKNVVDLAGSSSSKAVQATKSDASSEYVLHSSANLLESFPEKIDDFLLENIDAAIYENQIIFQERIRKNQLTIQNLKLQDQLLSKCIEDFRLTNDVASFREYENVCYENGRTAKNWRKYLQNIETLALSNASAQHSDFYQNSGSNVMCSFDADDDRIGGERDISDNLYINENELKDDVANGMQTNDSSLTYQETVSTAGDESMLMPCYKKILQWQSNKLSTLSNESKISKCSCGDSDTAENVYMNMTKNSSTEKLLATNEIGRKNILVETINKINIADSPVKSLERQKPI